MQGLCSDLCIVCTVFLFPLLFTYNVVLKRGYNKPYTATVSVSQLCRVRVVFQTIGVLSDSNGINGSKEDFIKRKGTCVSKKDLSLLVKKYSQKNSTEKPPVQSLPGAAF